MLSEDLKGHHQHHSDKLENGAHFALPGAGGLKWARGIEQGHCHEEYSRDGAGRALETN
jgi:hypothetical protein